MRTRTKNDERQFRVILVLLVALLLLASLPGCVARHMPDWSRVQEVKPATETHVRLYDRGASDPVKGRFLSATENSLTLQYEEGQTETFHKGDVRKVLTRRPFGKRWPGWAALGISLGVFSGFRGGDFTSAGKAFYVGIVPVAISTAFFYGSKMGGIYEVLPNQRDWHPQGTSSPPAKGKTPKKGEGDIK